MVDYAKGSGLYLAVGLKSGQLTEISGEAKGLSGFDISTAEQQRPVPGGGDVEAQQGLGYQDGTASFTVDENVDTRGLFWMKNGARFWFEYGPEGTDTGKEKFTGSAIATITHAFEEGGVRRFQVQLQAVGAITVGKY